MSRAKRGPAVWVFRWRELADNGKRTHRGNVLGSADRLVDEAAAPQAVSDPGCFRYTDAIESLSSTQSRFCGSRRTIPHRPRTAMSKKHYLKQ